MVFTEIIKRNGKKYYYRVKSVRKKGKVEKERVYLGVDLDKQELKEKEAKADKELIYLNNLLTEKEIKELEKIKSKFSIEPIENFENRYEAFVSDFTYNSTAIEGNTLSLQETSQLLFDRITPRKSLREINESLNHKKAFDFILNYKGDITKEFICELHKIVVKDALKPELASQTGCFRKLQVYVRGTGWIPPKPTEVPAEIKTLLSWYSKNKNKLHPLIVAAYFHAGFETIHPFVDGNGRVGRLLMNFILHKSKYPMINIPNSVKYKYYDSLETAHMQGDLRPLVEYLCNLMIESKLFF